MHFDRSKCLRFMAPATVAIPLLAGAAVFSGCAGAGSGPVSIAHQVHSMTPCGMMMNMMSGGHGDHQPEHASHEAGTVHGAQTGAEEAGVPHVHSVSPDDK